MQRTQRRRAIAQLALIWPYDPRGGVVGGILALGDGEIRRMEAEGYRVVAPVRSQAPYTHVVAAGGQDYLATLS